MAKQTRFDSLLGAAKTADTRAEQEDGADQSPVEAKPAIEGTGEFWAQFEEDAPEATDRLDVQRSKWASEPWSKRWSNGL